MANSIHKTILNWGTNLTSTVNTYFKKGVRSITTTWNEIHFDEIVGKIKTSIISAFYTFQIMTGNNPRFIEEKTKKIQELYKKKQTDNKPYLTQTFAPEITFDEKGNPGLTRPSPTIKRLVFEGGGAKGLVYGPFFETLDKELHLLDTVEEVAGSSAGALMAFMVAAGVPPEEIRKQSAVNLQDFLFGTPLEGLELGKKGLFSAHALTRSILESTRKEAHKYMSSMPQDNWDKVRDMDPECLENFKKRMNSDFIEGLTFYDLKILNTMNPQKFKLLHVTAYNKKEHKGVYFNAKDSPNVFCHKAVRASMAIPFVFKSVIINGEKLYDGGMETNKPLRLFSDLPKEETLMLVFDKKGQSHKIMHSPENEYSSLYYQILLSPAKKISEAIHNLFTGVPEKTEKWHGETPNFFRALYIGPNYWKNQKVDAELMHHHGPNVLIIPHTLHSLSFGAKASIVKENIHQAMKVAHSYANIRAGMLIHEKYGSIDEAIKSLSPEEIRQIQELPEKEIQARINQGLPAYQKIADHVPIEQKDAFEARLEILQANAKRKLEFYSKIRNKQPLSAEQAIQINV